MSWDLQLCIGVKSHESPNKDPNLLVGSREEGNILYIETM